MHKPVMIGLVGELRREVVTFVGQELRLVQAELREKFQHYKSAGATAAGGGVAAYAAFIVFLTGLGFLLSFLFARLGLETVLARFVGFALVGVLTSAAGAALCLSSIKVLSRQSLAPHKTIETIERISPVPITPAGQAPARSIHSRSSKDLEANVLATQRRLAKTLEKVTGKTNPMRYIDAVVTRVQAHPYRWGLFALGAGFFGSYVLMRQLSSPAKSS